MKNKSKIGIIIFCTIIVIAVIFTIIICVNLKKNSKIDENLNSNIQNNLNDKVEGENEKNINTDTDKSSSTSNNEVNGNINSGNSKLNENTSNNNSDQGNSTTSTKENDEEAENISKQDVVENNDYEEKSYEDSMVGTWNTVSVMDMSTAETYTNLKDIFGTSYITYGSYLKLNADKTFEDFTYPVTNSKTPTSGTYEILRNYYKMGDCYVQLKYSNGETITAQRVFRDNTNTAYLTFNRDNLSYDLKK